MTSTTKRGPNFDAAVAAYFRLFEPTLTLADALLSRQKYAQEVVLLICARLDALAGGTVPDDTTSRGAFVSFVLNYGRRKDLLSRVSVPDLYYELRYHQWLAEGMVAIPGRVSRFSSVNDPALLLLRESGVPITAEAAERLFGRIAAGLQSEFRVKPGQSKTKEPLVSSSEVCAGVRRSVKSLASAAWLEAGMKSLLENCTVAGLLYGKYRNEAVHGVQVLVDEDKFIELSVPYWKAMYSDLYGNFLDLRLPGRFLLDLLRDCLRTYREHLRAKHKLPPVAHHAAVGRDWNTHFDWLDTELLPETRELTFKLPSR